ncbi:unnamed protein product [Leptosia nina]|uniref:Protein male-specific lethal-3 n=1 Tax=Leptosia nina TaxID=320188 RepID=A0AAV1J9X6_9NEOP
MVSTRSVRYKFSEGERVLCYEPDPTKAKVLYDSKVLEVIENKDKRGKRTVEYLIHFQGWNSSWDRCVSEDFVLKDTEENRQLQRDLAEKSQLQLGAYLYRRERKKGSSSTTGSSTAKRVRHGFSDDGSSSSTQPEDGEMAVDTDTSSGSRSSAPQGSSPVPGNSLCRAQITIPPTLRDRLTLDYHLIAKRGKVVNVPASPSATEILESVVKWFGRAGAWNPPRGKHEPPQKPDILEVSARLNLVREVADGLRVYFDFVFRGHLLYKQEVAQYHEMCGQYNDFPTDMNSDGEDQENQSPDDEQDDDEDIKSPRLQEYSHLPPDPDYDDDEPLVKRFKHEDRPIKKEVNDEVHIKVETIDPEPIAGPSHYDDSQAALINVKIKIEKQEIPEKQEEDDTEEKIITQENHDRYKNDRCINNDRGDGLSGSDAHDKIDSEHKFDKVEMSDRSDSDKDKVERNGKREKNEDPAVGGRAGTVARRLRSNKSVLSQSESDDTTLTPTATEQKAFETPSSSAVSSGSSTSEYRGGEGDDRRGLRREQAYTPQTTTRNPLSLLMDKVSKFQLIPREGTEHLPCRVYGAIHLARLFVILPLFLNSTQMPDMKLKLILKYIDIFVQYLDEHNEWFGENFYVPNNFLHVD